MTKILARIVDPNIHPSFSMKCSVCGIMIFGDMAYNIQEVHKSCLVNGGFSVEVDFANLEICLTPRAVDLKPAAAVKVKRIVASNH